MGCLPQCNLFVALVWGFWEYMLSSLSLTSAVCCTLLQPRAVDYMRRVVQWNSPEAGSIRYTALYHIGIAYLEGYGVQQSNTEAERSAEAHAQCLLTHGELFWQ